jgi:hypothetical protein
MSLSYWDGAYRSDRKIWGKRPSEIALAAAKFASDAGIPTGGIRTGCLLPGVGMEDPGDGRRSRGERGGNGAG